MIKYIYLFIYISSLFGVTTLRGLEKEMKSYFTDNRIEQILPKVEGHLENLKSSTENNKEKGYLEVYLKVWEIKGHFYLGEIDKALSKFEILKAKIKKDNYN